jgi:hypothetical protein
MDFFREAFEEHMREATASTSEYYEFDSLWKAFNVYYSTLAERTDPAHVHEMTLILRAIYSIPAAAYSAILSNTLTERFRTIQPVANARTWARFGRRSVAMHTKAKRALEEIRAGHPATFQHLLSVIEVLYLVRCNMAHGLKSRYNERDRDVFNSTLPILRAFIANLPGWQASDFGAA